MNASEKKIWGAKSSILIKPHQGVGSRPHRGVIGGEGEAIIRFLLRPPPVKQHSLKRW